MQTFPICTLTEANLDSVIWEAGGIRAHPNADRRTLVGADYVMGTTVIELKMLDEEGFDKPERQAKLAELFRKHQPDRPVVVLDSGLLPESELRKYRNIIEQPIKRAIAKSKQQLAQSRAEFPETTGSVLWIVNNGYTALDHDTLMDLVANRVRQDTASIDGVIVSGCYYHSDGFDSVFLWPCAYVPIRLDRSFPEFDRLQESFHGFANNYMTALMRQVEPVGDKFEVRDLVFDVDGVTYVRPAPVMGEASNFYINGRPRQNSSDIDTCPPVAVIAPGLTRTEHARIAGVINVSDGPLSSYASWQQYVANATDDPIEPLVTIPVDAETWLRWCLNEGVTPSLHTLSHYAQEQFEERVQLIIRLAHKHTTGGIVASTYILAVTQEIGQDRANDISDIVSVRERVHGEPLVRPLAKNMRIFHEHALALAAAYAIREGVDTVLWNKNCHHGWR